jgi:hypothetical protein
MQDYCYFLVLVLAAARDMGKGKGKVILEQAMKAQRGSRGIALLFL